MPPHIHRDQPVIMRQFRLELAGPREPALRKAMDEKNRAPFWVTCFNGVDLGPSTACNPVMLHFLRLSALRADPICKRLCRNYMPMEWPIMNQNRKIGS